MVNVYKELATQNPQRNLGRQQNSGYAIALGAVMPPYLKRSSYAERGFSRPNVSRT